MTISRINRPLGTMVTYGYVDGGLAHDMALARRLGATCLEVLPQWRVVPDPRILNRRVTDAGFSLHSAHGCWGGQAISTRRVDLASPDPQTRSGSLDDLRRCVDWLHEAEGQFLVVHPGGLSDPCTTDARRSALLDSLVQLADHATHSSITLCVENMPPGVHPGSGSGELAEIVREINRPEIGLAMDTGHAHLVASPAAETLAMGHLLRTTHVHDNDGRQDLHLPPGLGTIDWSAWVGALNAVDYRGPIMLECIRHIRNHPDCLTPEFTRLLAEITGIL